MKSIGTFFVQAQQCVASSKALTTLSLMHTNRVPVKDLSATSATVVLFGGRVRLDTFFHIVKLHRHYSDVLKSESGSHTHAWNKFGSTRTIFTEDQQ